MVYLKKSVIKKIQKLHLLFGVLLISVLFNINDANAEVINTENTEYSREVMYPIAKQETISGNDLVVGDREVASENAEENTILHSGRDGAQDWSIDNTGCLRISGIGNYIGMSNGYLPPEWTEYSDEITSAEVSVSEVTITETMFYGCNNLVSVDFTNSDLSQVTNMGAMFYGCSSLKTLDLSPYKMENV